MIAVFAIVLAMQMTGCKDNKDTIDTQNPVVTGVSVSGSDIESKAEITWKADYL